MVLRPRFWRLSAACLLVLQGLLTPLAAAGFAPDQATASAGPAIPRPSLPTATATATVTPTTTATAATPAATTLPTTMPATATVPVTATVPATATASLSATATDTLTPTAAASDTATAPALPLATTTPGDDQSAGTANYFIGSDSTAWRTGLPTFSRVTYRDVYPGTDLVYYGSGGQLEYDRRLAPGADPGAIAFTVDGARGLRVDGDGNLVIDTPAGALAQHAPVAYQEVEGRKRRVESRYVVAGTAVRFALGAYDQGKPLVIDPTLSYSTYLGGSGDETAYGIAVDTGGNIYVSGATGSANFPTTAGAFQTQYAGSDDVFVTKINPAGQMVYSTYLGGNTDDNDHSVAVDGAGNAYVTGQTNSIDFRTTAGAVQTRLKGNYDAFVTKVSANGAGFGYSTYLGGSGEDWGSSLAVDASGNAYVAGATYSTDLPTTGNAIQSTYGGSTSGTDVFVSEVNASGTALVYATYLGAAANGWGFGIAVDPTGAAYVTGKTDSASFITTTNALQPAYGGGTLDAFVTKMYPLRGYETLCGDGQR